MQELGSSAKESEDPMAHTSTPKYVEEVAAKIMKVNKAAKLFQTMVIMNVNMVNLTLEVNTLNNRLVIGDKEKAML